jgi:hypothetical protein
VNKISSPLFWHELGKFSLIFGLPTPNLDLEEKRRIMTATRNADPGFFA